MIIVLTAAGVKKGPKELEEFKVQIQKIDGSVAKVANYISCIDVTIPEGNYSLVK